MKRKNSFHTLGSSSVFVFAFLISLVIGLNSCTTKESKDRELTNIEQIIDHIRLKNAELNAKEWKFSDDKISYLIHEIDVQRADFTDEQIRRANKLIGKYNAIKIKNGLNEVKNSVKDLGEQFEGAMQEFSDSFK
jgi:hypothetical protein